MDCIDNWNRSAQGGNITPLEHKEKKRKNEKCRGMPFTRFQVEDPIIFNEETMRYLIYGTETCPTTGKSHHQGYVYWRNARYPGACAKRHKCSFFFQEGSNKQAIDYCKKSGTYVEFGNAPHQGARKDLDELKDDLLKGITSVDNIIIEDPMTYHQYGRTLEKIEDLVMRKKFRTEMTTCEWIVGPTGVGKSQKAFKNYSPDTHYNLNIRDNGWWEGYKQQDTVVINDYRGQLEYDHLLNLIDWVPLTVKRRNREPMPFMSKHIIITSPLTPEEVYNKRHAKDSLEQLMRRVVVTDMRPHET